jgi:hypothetical protein
MVRTQEQIIWMSPQSSGVRWGECRALQSSCNGRNRRGKASDDDWEDSAHSPLKKVVEDGKTYPQQRGEAMPTTSSGATKALVNPNHTEQVLPELLLLPAPQGLLLSLPTKLYPPSLQH